MCNVQRNNFYINPNELLYIIKRPYYILLSSSSDSTMKERKAGTGGGSGAKSAQQQSQSVKVTTASGSNTDDVTTATTSSTIHSGDEYYSYDTDRLDQWKNDKVYMNDPKYFQKVMISPTAIMKMMMHCQSGVEKGIQKGGNPIEVMGILLGKPDMNQSNSLIVTDAFPLPIEGFETRVIADDINVTNHMISLGDILEKNRYEKFMGWYHSHPFDYIPNQSHCFLSQTDLSTQLQWQRAEDPHGNPFVAIVIDPIRSTIHHTPELKAFRAYPPEYNSTIQNECPDSTIEIIEQIRLEKWGSCWNRYYELDVEYYMSRTSRKVLETLTKDFLWIRALNNQPISKRTDQLIQSTKQFEQAASSSTKVTTSSNTATKSKSLSTTTTSSNTGTVPTSTSILKTGTSCRYQENNNIDSSTANTSTAAVIVSSSGGALSSIDNNMNSNSGIIIPTPSTINNRSIEWNKVIQQLSNITEEQKSDKVIETTKKYIFS